MNKKSVSFIARNQGVGEHKKIEESKQSDYFKVYTNGGSIFKDGTKILNRGIDDYPDPIGTANNYYSNKGFYKNAIKKNSNEIGRLQDEMGLSEVVSKMNRSINLADKDLSTFGSIRKNVNYYNRFKISNPNNILQKAFPHVFFVRPSCNVLSSDGRRLSDSVKNNEMFAYTFKNSPEIVKQLSTNGKMDNDFMMLLSNEAGSFSLSDEYINTNTYGNTYTGHKISYGKSSIESKTAGTFNISYTDDRNLSIYQLHRLWVEYISGCYRGELSPLNKTIYDKILDYCGALYYILTAEDGETILFWSKYYGVFPTSIPSSQYSWAEGNILSNPSLDISYQYSWKEDYNPYSILEFNYNARMDSNEPIYMPTYDPKLGHSGTTWVGSPFIELIQSNQEDCPYYFKLRFLEKKKNK